MGLFGGRREDHSPEWSSGTSLPKVGIAERISSAFAGLLDAAKADENKAVKFAHKFTINASKAEEALKSIQPALLARELAVKEAIKRYEAAPNGVRRDHAKKDVATCMGSLKAWETRYNAQYKIFEFFTVMADKLRVYMPLEGQVQIKESKKAMGIIDRMYERFMSAQDEVDTLLEVLSDCGTEASGSASYGNDPLVAEALARFATPDSGFAQRNPNVERYKLKGISF